MFFGAVLFLIAVGHFIIRGLEKLSDKLFGF